MRFAPKIAIEPIKIAGLLFNLADVESRKKCD